ncbi:MAG: hypothetical protein LC732_01910 [Acidobacteria bacterium]|nr:hypothetical protein [Acidobacteriota bacterium]
MKDAETHPDELDTMLAFLVEFAQMMLRDRGGFLPFGSGITPEGQMVSGSTDVLPPDSTPAEILSFVHTDLVQRAGEGEIVAAGICTDVQAHPPGASHPIDAICVELEHANGEAIHVYLPYTIEPEGKVTYGELFATPGEQAIFLPVAG